MNIKANEAFFLYLVHIVLIFFNSVLKDKLSICDSASTHGSLAHGSHQSSHSHRSHHHHHHHNSPHPSILSPEIKLKSRARTRSTRRDEDTNNGKFELERN